jgi:hypothetical protein
MEIVGVGVLAGGVLVALGAGAAALAIERNVLADADTPGPQKSTAALVGVGLLGVAAVGAIGAVAGGAIAALSGAGAGDAPDESAAGGPHGG